MYSIFDFDGTITVEGCDLWYLASKHFAKDPQLFDLWIAEWKPVRDKDPFRSSLEIMKKTISSMKTSANELFLFGIECAKSFLVENKLRPAAVDYINKTKNKVIIATTGYEDCLRGFVSYLYQEKVFFNMPIVSGTQIDWSKKTVIHFNMGDLKNIGSANALGIPAHELIYNLLEAFGDDPKGNDEAILRYARQAYTIITDKNFENYVGTPLNW